ncbi:Tyrosine-protein phosphatase precursor [compost metagenome]
MKLQGAINFRDMGGLPTVDGRRLKNKFFYRSGSLSRLTEADCQHLESLAITHVIDYRDVHESDKDRDILWKGVNYECCPANPASHAVTAAVGDLFTEERLNSLPMNFMETLYQQLPFTNSAYQRLFQKTADLTSGALLQHCAVGKDRTGVGSALLLSCLGVTKEAVLEDYLKTEVGLQPFKVQIMHKVEPLLSSAALKKFEYMMSASENFFHAAFNEIQNRYGNLEKFFSVEFGLTPEKRTVLQNRFLE